MSIFLFFKALCKHWWALMSCAIFTALGVYAAWQQRSNHWVVVASATAAGVLFLVAAGLAWNEEHRKRETAEAELQDEISKRGRPDLTAEFLIVASPPKAMLRLHNSSPSPAVGIHVDDIRIGHKVLRFFPPSAVNQSSPGEFVDCRILENGWGTQYDVFALFEGYKFTGDVTQSLDLRIQFSNLDSAASKKTWSLHYLFWYDKSQGKLFLNFQSIDPMP